MKSKDATKGWIKKATAALLVLAFALVAMNIKHFDKWFLSIDSARQWILLHGILEAAAIFFVANTFACAFGFPRLWSSAFAGVVFGGPLGLATSLPSSILGTWITFEFGRKIGAKGVLSKIATRWKNTAIPTFSPDIFQTTLLRQLPIPGVILTLLFSATHISRKVFLLGSSIGFIPGAVIACFLGYTATTKQTMASLTMTSCAILLAIAVLAYMQRKRKQSMKVES